MRRTCTLPDTLWLACGELPPTIHPRAHAALSSRRRASTQPCTALLTPARSPSHTGTTRTSASSSPLSASTPPLSPPPPTGRLLRRPWPRPPASATRAGRAASASATSTPASAPAHSTRWRRFLLARGRSSAPRRGRCARETAPAAPTAARPTAAGSTRCMRCRAATCLLRRLLSCRRRPRRLLRPRHPRRPRPRPPASATRAGRAASASATSTPASAPAHSTRWRRFLLARGRSSAPRRGRCARETAPAAPTAARPTAAGSTRCTRCRAAQIRGLLLSLRRRPFLPWCVHVQTHRLPPPLALSMPSGSCLRTWVYANFSGTYMRGPPLAAPLGRVRRQPSVRRGGVVRPLPPRRGTGMRAPRTRSIN